MWTFVSFLLPFHNITGWIIYKDAKCIFHSFRGWETQYQSSDVSGGSYTGQAKRGPKEQEIEFSSSHNHVL